MKDVVFYTKDDATVNMLAHIKKITAAYNKAALIIEKEIVDIHNLRVASKEAAGLALHTGDLAKCSKEFRKDLDGRLLHAYTKRACLLARFKGIRQAAMHSRICTVVCGPGQDVEVVRDTALQYIKEKHPEYIGDKSCIDVADNSRAYIYRYPVNDKDSCVVLYNDVLFAADNFEEFGVKIDDIFSDLMP